MVLLLAILGTLAAMRPGRAILQNIALTGIAGTIIDKAKHLSPIEGVTDVAWRRFVRMMEGPDPKEVSPALHLGLYNIGYHRLKELGLVSEARQVTKGGRRVWVGRFKAPLTLGLFLNNPTLQYTVFVRDMVDRVSLVLPYVGREIEGKRASLSGLMATAKLAGRKGFLSWVSDPAERQKHHKTTRAFLAFNEVF